MSNSVSSISLSGMSAAQAQLDTAAHNIANSNTENFRRQKVTQTEAKGGGVDVSFSKETAPSSNMAGDAVSEMMAKYSFLANVRVFKSHDAMAGALFKIKA